jgi:hypothetical protein
LTGGWWERHAISCADPEATVPGVFLGPVFEADGTFSFTRFAFEVYRDYWGTYAHDVNTGRLTMTISGGNNIPDSLDLDGTFEVLADGAIRLELELFEAVASRYLAAADGFLTEVEKQNLVTASNVITFEQGVRFLADFLDGDTYYKTTHSSQNLDRTRNQFHLFEALTENETAMGHVFD